MPDIYELRVAVFACETTRYAGSDLVMTRIACARRNTAAVAVAAAVAVSGCDGVITAGTESAWQEKYAAALLPGYTDFRGLGGSGDVGVAIFSYTPAANNSVTNPAAAVASQIARTGCYKAIRVSDDEFQLRCTTASPGGAFEEYRVRWKPEARRVIVMYGDFDSKAEIVRYSRFESMFLSRAESE